MNQLTNRAPLTLVKDVDNATCGIQPRPCLDDQDQSRVLEARSQMIRWATRLAHAMNLGLSPADIRSAADFGLCDAARRFRPTCGASFATYSRHFIRGELLKIRRERCEISRNEIVVDSNGNDEHREGADFLESMPAPVETSSPEALTETRGNRQAISAALSQLTQLERQVFLRIHLGDEKVAAVARAIKYSRGHTSEIRRLARMKLQHALGNEIAPIAA